MHKFILLILLTSLNVNAGALTWKSTKETVAPTDKDPTATVHFAFTNTSAAPVSLTSAKGSCADCTELVWEEKTYAPGESGELIATVKTAGLNGRSVKFITVVTSDNPKFPDRLELVIDAPQKLVMPKEGLRWDRDDMNPQEIPVSSAIPGAIPFIKAIKPAGIFTVTLETGENPNKAHRLRIIPQNAINQPRRAMIIVGLRSPDGVEYTESVTASRR